jgi:hypothetical protein
MATSITYADIQSYLDAIMAKDKNPISGSPHQVWWHSPNTPEGGPLTYADFTTGMVSGIGVPIMDTTNPANSAFYVILTDLNGFQGMPQMPFGGPHITDPGYTANLASGQTITGQKIQTNMLSWLTNGFPES